MTEISAVRRVVFVHAHPDDESTSTGATMAHYAAAPDTHVTLVTCTLGEEGEIHVPQLARLVADEADQLGGYRIGEWERACEALGVSDRRMLGGAGAYRDSGMMGTPANHHPRAFWQADVTQAAGDLVSVLREVRPQVLVTYDSNGFYGHPDHIQTHRVAMAAAQLSADEQFRPELGPPHKVAKTYWTTVPKSMLMQGFEVFRESADNPFADVETAEDLPFGVDDDEVTAHIVASQHGEAKIAALRCHATQVPEDNWMFILAAKLGPESVTSEHYILVDGDRGPGGPPHDWESDLFAGIK